MGEEISKTRTVRAVETAFDIVEFVQERDGARIYEIAEGLELANSTVYHHLNTLIKRRYVTKVGDVYQPGLEFLQVGGYARERTRVNRLSERLVNEVAQETGEQVQFIVEENGYGYHVYTAPGERATPIDTRPGKRIYLHANAAGKAIIAHYPDSRIEEIINAIGLPELTEYTITDPEELAKELDQVRQQGYAFNSEEHVKGYCGIAVPVQTDEAVLGSLALGGPVERIQNRESEDSLAQKLREAANELELQLKFNNS